MEDGISRPEANPRELSSTALPSPLSRGAPLKFAAVPVMKGVDGFGYEYPTVGVILVFVIGILSPLIVPEL